MSAYSVTIMFSTYVSNKWIACYVYVDIITFTIQIRQIVKNDLNIDGNQL